MRHFFISQSLIVLYFRRLTTYVLYVFTVEDIYAALSRCATLHPSTDDESTTPALDLGSLVTGDEDEVDGETVEEAVETNGTSNATNGEAGRVRQDYATPDSRFAPY